ncbi:cysteine--tRNA ligase [Paenibacillus thiaminolyticus]|uniref:Cysteine--tRNA ligase n=1 Tax=Paenibacillus thiaminolyticus TaxID=49283 RepID=A0AAP9DU90_PANTH|nr:cysteine--tRNA ligase [Paenibacillus thiaminolyticus]MCY9537549.1 cysteine--tRNA ligase [Paenibacillus thiaminolyticus]MCY9604754.1 cysteine--tRNA ligase [Paenibacillus thiaminolyticus]MCY9609694.1 cysteine--tRNA ligase [Paenibacillus thiaminolyticus]MCY9615404.1 cysteine--tRNA ligase [Paenibacillus thiaminolyticus]MCY9620473.1 cysteine--tRNA ligase [Paenibacillus thiaminolyticus]
MTLQIYNTMTRRKETFEPIHPDKVNMYVCGPTVYDYIHIGNARPQIVFDVVRRYLEQIGYEVNYVVNFTDVDDRLIRKSIELGEPVPVIAEKFIQAFYEDIDGIGVRRATHNPRVLDHIEEIIAFIANLVEEGYAYESGKDVYFRTNRFAEYGKLSHQNLEELQHGIRVEVDERKENPEDFVLWKAAKPGEISWPSPWGEGRPGWHIECSAMARKFLGDTLDIHGGGQDLQFPHHECEVAQSESLTGKPLANIWMHNGYIHINNEKMSKSLGNGVIVKELRARYKMEAIRYFILATHYRNPLNFSEEAMMQAEKSVGRIVNAVQNLRHLLKSAEDAAEREPDEALQQKLAGILDTFDAKMQEDFNTADAITAVFDWVNLANSTMQQGTQDERQTANLQALLDAVEAMNNVLGLVPEQEEEDLLDEEIDRLIQERTDARKAKNWARADEIRDMLTAEGIILEDTPQGIRWRRK